MLTSRKTVARIYRLVAPLWLTLVLALDRLAWLFIGLPSPDPGRVLVVRADAIGDLVLWLPAAAALRRRWPAGQYHLTLVCGAAAAELALGGPFDAVWPVDVCRLQRDPLYRLEVHRRIRRAGFGVAVQPTFSRTFDGDELTAASGAPERIGCSGDTANVVPGVRWLTDKSYTRLIALPAGARHETERNAAFSAALTGDAVPPVAPMLPVPEALPAALAAAVPAGPYAVLGPGSLMALKRWPSERFADVARHLVERGLAVVICGDDPDRATAEAIRERVLSVQILAGRTSLNDVARLIAGARLVVSNDTSLVHIAAAVGTPVVAVLGGGHPGRFLPYPPGLSSRAPAAVFETLPCYDCGWECVHRVPGGSCAPCIERVGTGSVLARIAGVLDAPG